MDIYITGDLHGDLRRFQPGIFHGQECLTKEDIVLVAGDFGCVWHGDERDDEGLNWLEEWPFTTAFVTGNHENYDALRKYPLEEWRGGNKIGSHPAGHFSVMAAIVSDKLRRTWTKQTPQTELLSR